MIKLFKRIKNNLKIWWDDYRNHKSFRLLYNTYHNTLCPGKEFNTEKWLFDNALNIKEITWTIREYMQVQLKELKYSKFNNNFYNPCVPLKFRDSEERIKYMKIIEDLLFEESKYLDK